ncbi:MAG: hypothetical protein WCT10_04900 [Patescibacteria group bacterium]|jgi:hypothetical protein
MRQFAFPRFNKRTLALAFLASILVVSSAGVAAAATTIGADISTSGALTVTGSATLGSVRSANLYDASGNPMLGFTAVGAGSSFYMQNNTAGNNPVFGVTGSANQGMTMMIDGDGNLRVQSSDAANDILQLWPSHSSSVSASYGNIMMKEDLTANREWYLQNAAGVIPLGTTTNNLFFTTTANTNLTLPVSGTLATLAGTETLTNKTLTSPIIAAWDGIYTSAGASAPALAVYGMPANVNYLEVGSGASGGPPGIAAKTTGADVNVGMTLGVMGTGNLVVQTNTANADTLALIPAAGGGASFIGRLTSADLTANQTWTLPNATGTLAISGANSDITSLSGANQIDYAGNLFIGTGAVAGSQLLYLGRSGYVTYLNGAGLFFSNDQADRIISVATNSAGAAENLVLRGQYGNGVDTNGGTVHIMGGHNGGAGTGAPGYVYFGDGSAAAVDMSSPGVDDVYMEGRLEVDGAMTVDSATLVVDSVNHRVGIGDATPTALLTVGSGDKFTVDASGNVVVSGLLKRSYAAVSAVGPDQPSATALTADINVVNGGAGGVRLPAAATGLETKIINRSGAGINIYPASGDLINISAANFPISLANQSTIWCTTLAAGAWDCVTMTW